MPRVVRDADEREWVVTARPHLRDPGARLAPVQTSDAVLRAGVLGVAGLLVVVVALSTPATLWFPGWLAGPLVLAGALAAAWWLLGRAWTVTVVPAVEGPGGGGPEGDEVRVRGPWAARRAHVGAVRGAAARSAGDDAGEDAWEPEPETAGRHHRPDPDEPSRG